jgi:hypothetical protein
MKSSRKAQAWGFDLMVASAIFVVAIATFYLFSMNNSHETEDNLQSLQYDGNNIADNLISQGYPENWTQADFTRIGILSNGRIDENKMLNFKELSETNYERTKSALDSANNYYITFSENITINGTDIEFIGLKETNPKNLIKTTRLTVYKERPIAVYINVWN